VEDIKCRVRSSSKAISRCNAEAAHQHCCRSSNNSSNRRGLAAAAAAGPVMESTASIWQYLLISGARNHMQYVYFPRNSLLMSVLAQPLRVCSILKLRGCLCLALNSAAEHLWPQSARRNSPVLYAHCTSHY
jgi:hypothetical protein